MTTELVLPIGQLEIYLDGNAWCVLLGEDIQTGVAGFGDSPQAAFRDFEREWLKALPGKEAMR